MENWVTFNTKYSEIWPVITEAKEPLSTAQEMDGKKNKMATHFSDKPAEVAA